MYIFVRYYFLAVFYQLLDIAQGFFIWIFETLRMLKANIAEFLSENLRLFCVLTWFNAGTSTGMGAWVNMFIYSGGKLLIIVVNFAEMTKIVTIKQPLAIIFNQNPTNVMFVMLYFKSYCFAFIQFPRQ